MTTQRTALELAQAAVLAGLPELAPSATKVHALRCLASSDHDHSRCLSFEPGCRVTIETTAGPATGRIVSAPFTIHDGERSKPCVCVAVELDREHQGYLSACPPDHDPVTWHTLRASSSVYVSTLVANVENLEPAPPADTTPDQ